MRTLVLAAVALTPSIGFAQTVFHDEGIHGDLSDNGLSPTAHALGSGVQRLIGTCGDGDIDYLAVTVPAGMKLGALTLAAYQSIDPVAFIGLMSGGQFTEPPATANPANLLGYSHFGPLEVGQDILDDMGNAFMAIGFDPPLPAGVYSFWIQQLMSGTDYTFDFRIDSACYPDCNADGLLTVADFGCFQTKFVAQDPYADCDASGVLTVADFGCFQTKFVVGCP